MRFLPVFFDLSVGNVILIGSAAPALAKLQLLRAAGAGIRWFPQDAEAAREYLAVEHYAGQIDIFPGEPADVAYRGVLAVVSAAGKEIDERVAARARGLGIPVNVVDRPDLSTFIFPAVVDRGEVVVAIGTGGASPVLARRLRERIEAILPERIGAFAALMRSYREKLAAVRAQVPEFSQRRFWEAVIDGPIGVAFLSGRAAKAEAALYLAVEKAGDTPAPACGVVHLVGAGPGDPDLLTLRALQVLQNADVIFYDELVGADILRRARRDAEKVFVGKRKGHPGIGQSEINRRMVEAAQAGRSVVRLKGGDPFIFGRGGEELEYLAEAGIEALVVPGITAALGCAAEVGLPLTFRKEATRLSFVTANTVAGADRIDWSGLFDAQTTVVVYMGLSSASAVRSGLIAAGRSPQTPVAVLARGTRPDARAAVGRLNDLPAVAGSVGEGPALLVIGDVVTRSDPWRQATLAAIGAAA